jgi:hypothetical protein
MSAGAPFVGATQGLGAVSGVESRDGTFASSPPEFAIHASAASFFPDSGLSFKRGLVKNPGNFTVEAAEKPNPFFLIP